MSFALESEKAKTFGRFWDCALRPVKRCGLQKERSHALSPGREEGVLWFQALDGTLARVDVTSGQQTEVLKGGRTASLRRPTPGVVSTTVRKQPR